MACPLRCNAPTVANFAKWKDQTAGAIQRLRGKINRDDITRWFARDFRPGQLGPITRSVAIILCMFFLADIVGIGLDYFIPSPPAVRSSGGMGGSGGGNARRPQLADYQAITTRNLFNAEGLIPNMGENRPKGDPVRTTLPLNLLGNVILKDELRSLATLEDKSNSTVYPVRVHDEIPGKLRVLRVESRRVIFRNLTNQQDEFVDLPEEPIQTPRLLGITRASTGPGITKNSETQFTIMRTEVDNALKDLNRVLTEARCVPHFEGGMPAGFRCFQIVKGSIYDQLGMKDNDVICGINGNASNDVSKVFEQLTSLKEASHIDLCIKRDGKQLNMAYDIK